MPLTTRHDTPEDANANTYRQKKIGTHRELLNHDLEIMTLL